MGISFVVFIIWLISLSSNLQLANTQPINHVLQQVSYEQYKQCTKLCVVEDFDCLDKCLDINYNNL